MPLPPKEILKETQALIQKDLVLDLSEEDYSEQDILDLLADYVLYQAEKNLEQLFSLLYRLDVNERKVHAAFSPNAKEPSNLVIAQLILDRQKEKAISRLQYRRDYDEDEEVSPW
jgi:hypothetical protein